MMLKMSTRGGSRAVTAICLWLLFVGVGCASLASTAEKTADTIGHQTKKIVRGITPFKSDFKRLVAVYRFENKALLAGRLFQPVFQEGIVTRLGNECSDILALPAEQINELSGFEALPRLSSGALDNFALAQIGRRIGLNAIATGALNNINLTQEIRGIMFRDAHYFIQVTIRVEVFDTATATKILDEIFTKELEIDEMEYASIQANREIDPAWLQEAFQELIVKMGNRICEALFDLSWAAFVVGTDGNLVHLSAGQRAGLEPGIVLDAFDSSKIITGVNGQRYIVPGLKIGEVKVQTVYPDRSEAEAVLGDDIQEGSILREK